jgi:hypothetical protein
MEKYTFCKKHGRQPAVGNYEECEACLIEYKREQLDKEFGMGRKHEGVSYKDVLNTVSTGKL